MKRYHSKRKKIRGWRRRLRQVERWGEWISQPDLDWFKRRGYTYERCTLSPFYMFEKRHPPVWFYKHIIAKLIAAFESWTKVFEEMDIYYDLHLWLYDPAYIRSEIICYQVKQQGELRRLSYESATDKPFPYAKLASPGYDLTRFDWVLAKDEDVVFESEYADFTTQDLLADGYTREVQQDGKVYYAKRLGDLWTGRRKGKLSTASSNVIQGYFAPPV
jgi:hypothetical protein